MVKEINSACSGIANILILGDFNYPQINWTNLTSTKGTDELFLKCVQDNFLEQCVIGPTRQKSLIDLIMVNDQSLVSDIVIGENLGNSDHNIVRFNMNVERKGRIQNKVKVLDLRNGDYNKLRNLLDLVNWDEEFRNKNCFQMWDKFKEILVNVQSQCFRMKQKREKNSLPRWWCREIRELINQKKSLFKKFRD